MSSQKVWIGSPAIAPHQMFPGQLPSWLSWGLSMSLSASAFLEADGCWSTLSATRAIGAALLDRADSLLPALLLDARFPGLSLSLRVCQPCKLGEPVFKHACLAVRLWVACVLNLLNTLMLPHCALSIKSSGIYRTCDDTEMIATGSTSDRPILSTFKCERRHLPRCAAPPHEDHGEGPLSVALQYLHVYEEEV